jgi:class 3 adenylate cyclase
MEPRIQYAKTSDGESIAYWTLGEGLPFIHLPATTSHIQVEWDIGWIRAWYQRLARTRMLVRFDPPGHGLSQRDLRSRLSADDFREKTASWIDSVADKLNMERFDLFAPHISSPEGISYAAREPARVRRLILFGAFARFEDYTVPALRAMRSIAGSDWETYTEAGANVTLGGWATGEQARELATLLRASIRPEDVEAINRNLAGLDVSEDLAQIQCPTLIIHRRDVKLVSLEVATSLAAAISGAQLLILEGAAAVPFAGDTEAVAAAIDDFLGEGGPGIRENATPSGLVTILFTDLVSSTAIAQRLGDAAMQEVRRAHNTIGRAALAEHGDAEIKHTGDGIMAAFPTASAALECAIAIQRAVAERADPNLQVHIGLNAGEPIAEERDLFGTSVDLAARIRDHAQAGQVLVSNVVRELAAGKGFLFSDIGEVVPKGFEEPVRLYEVRWDG